MLLDVNESCHDIVLQLIRKAAHGYGLPTELTAADALVDAGMTSMAMVDLMFAVEARFDITIPDAELTSANFRSGDSIAAMVQRIFLRNAETSPT